jgi:hypothetical protein
MHAPLEVHDTPDSQPDQPDAVGIGVGWTDQVDPFQSSTNGTVAPVSPTVDSPTATHSRRDVHETPNSLLSLERAGPAAGCIDQPAAAADRPTAATTTPAPTRSIS